MNRTLSIIMLLVLCAGVAAAQVAEKNTTVSIGSYAINWSSDVEDSDDIKFKGFALGGTIAMSPSMAIRGGYFMTELDADNDADDGDVKLNGFEAQLLLGSNLNGMGFKIYGLGGYFQDTVEETYAGETDDEDYSGLMFGGGLGYNWNGAAIDFSIAWRQEDDYTDGDSSKTTEEPNITMMSGSLSIGLRF